MIGKESHNEDSSTSLKHVTMGNYDTLVNEEKMKKFWNLTTICT